MMTKISKEGYVDENASGACRALSERKIKQIHSSQRESSITANSKLVLIIVPHICDSIIDFTKGCTKATQYFRI